MPANYQPSGLGDQAIEVDPSARGTIVRTAMLIESLFNLPFAYLCIFHPRASLEYVLADGVDATPAAASAMQSIGVFTFMISALLWRALPDTRQGVETRRPAYVMLAASEVAVVSVWAWQAYGLGEEGSGWKKSVLVSLIAQIVPLCGFRLYALLQKPEWFGRYRIKAKEN